MGILILLCYSSRSYLAKFFVSTFRKITLADLRFLFMFLADYARYATTYPWAELGLEYFSSTGPTKQGYGH